MDPQYAEFPGLKLKYHVFGTRKSPRLLVTAAIRGDEVTGVYAAYRLVDYLKLREEIGGAATVVPAVNVLGSSAKTRFNCRLRRHEQSLSRGDRIRYYEENN